MPPPCGSAVAKDLDDGRDRVLKAACRVLVHLIAEVVDTFLEIVGCLGRGIEVPGREGRSDVAGPALQLVRLLSLEAAGAFRGIDGGVDSIEGR